MPEWTANMVEKSFNTECQTEYEQLLKTYKCLTCKYYKEQKTMMGILPKCTFKVRDGHKLPRNHATFELRKTCKNYEKGEPIRI